MKIIICAGLILVLLSCSALPKNEIADTSKYLQTLKLELQKKWPHNKTINLVFHGHSVPSGYFKTPIVNTLEAYPFLVLKRLKARYPYAVINIINTAIGGENSVKGAKRFVSEVLIHQPDVLFIDYALNDRKVGLEKAYKSWEAMLKKAKQKNIKVILLTPSPDQRTSILEPHTLLEQHRNQVVKLAKTHGVGLVDSYNLFKNRVIEGDRISNYMSQVNHPNRKGHLLIANEVCRFFE